MTVNELIEMLQRLPEEQRELPVWTLSANDEAGVAAKVEHRKGQVLYDSGQRHYLPQRVQISAWG